MKDKRRGDNYTAHGFGKFKRMIYKIKRTFKNVDMKKETKEKIGYWIENMLYLGGIAFGFSIVVGGVYALYWIIKSLIF
jgi:hypothetical protein